MGRNREYLPYKCKKCLNYVSETYLYEDRMVCVTCLRVLKNKLGKLDEEYRIALIKHKGLY